MWIFGDTFVGTPSHPIDQRFNAGFISNTVGISHCEGGQWNVEYFWRKAPLRPVFMSSDPTAYAYWPAETFVHQGVLYILFWRAQYTPGQGLGFLLKGVTVAKVVDSSAADPRNWVVTYNDLTTNISGGDNAYPAASAVVQGAYVYLYTNLEGPNFTTNPIVLTRSPIQTFGTASQTLAYYSKAGKWKAGLNIQDAKILIQNGASKFNVRYHATSNTWLATYHLPFFSQHIFSRTSNSLMGPWSEPTPIFEIPELIAGTPEYREGLFCYGGEEHSQYRTSTEMLLTYTCNSMDIELVRWDMSVYVPKIVRLPAP